MGIILEGKGCKEEIEIHDKIILKYYEYANGDMRIFNNHMRILFEETLYNLGIWEALSHCKFIGRMYQNIGNITIEYNVNYFLCSIGELRSMSNSIALNSKVVNHELICNPTLLLASTYGLPFKKDLIKSMNNYYDEDKIEWIISNYEKDTFRIGDYTASSTFAYDNNYAYSIVKGKNDNGDSFWIKLKIAQIKRNCYDKMLSMCNKGIKFGLEPYYNIKTIEIIELINPVLRVEHKK